MCSSGAWICAQRSAITTSTGVKGGAQLVGDAGSGLGDEALGRAGGQASAQRFRGPAGVADEAGTRPHERIAAAQEGEIGLGLGAAVGEGSKQRRVEAAHPGEVLGVDAI